MQVFGIAFFPISITDLGMVSAVKFEHPLNAFSPIPSKFSDNDTSEIWVLFLNTPPAIDLIVSGITTPLFVPLYFISTLSPTVTNSSFNSLYHGLFWNA